MNWTGAANTPVISSSSTSNNLKIYGSLTLIDAMTWSFNGKVYFEATTTGKTITSFNKNFLNEVHFNGAGGGWTLQDAFSCNYTTFLNYGHLNTNNQNLTLYRFYSNNTNIRGLTLGASLVTFNYPYEDAFYVYLNAPFTLNAGTSTLRFTGNNNNQTGMTLYNTSANFYFYNVEFTGPSGTGYIYNSNPAYSGNFNNVTFNGHGTITGNNTYNNIAFTAGKTYTLPASRTQTITGNFTAAGSSGQLIDIRSSSSGTQANIAKSSGCIIADYLQLKDNNALGGANWYAGSHSTNSGNNTGWTWSDPTVLGTPGAISGPSSVCLGGTEYVYSIAPVTGTNSYNWTVPSGASITGGAGTANITVDMGTATAGNISVTAANTCFTSTAGMLTLTFQPNVTPSVTISASPAVTICEGTPVTFTASPTNGGTPTYQWLLNGANVGTNNPVYTKADLANGNTIQCVMTTTVACVTSPTDTSNKVTMVVNPEYSINNPQSTCNGNSYIINGHNYSMTGTYYDTLATVFGCDSVIITQLTINPEYAFVENYSICNGDSYTWQGTDYATAGSYTAGYTSIHGCDSIYTLILTVNPEYSFTENYSICNGESYNWQGTDYTTAGSYTASYTSIHGCDSIYTLNFTVNPEYSFTENYSICNGESYTWQGTDYTTAGSYTAGYTSIHGCDSIYTLNLTVNPVYAFTENHSICNGDSYTWQGTDYATAGSYTAGYTSIHGCDSIYTLILAVNHVDIGVTLSGLIITADSIADGYQWLDCNNSFAVMAGETSQNFTASINGYYAVKVAKGQCSDTSECIQIASAGITSPLTEEIYIYPNPVSSELTIEIKGNSNTIKFDLMNLTGQIVYKGTLIEKTVVLTTDFIPGVYLLKLEIGKAVVFKKIIKE